MVCMKPSHTHSVSGFWPKSHPLASDWQMRSPPATSMPSTHTHYLLAPPHTAVSYGVPETEPCKLNFGFLAQIPPPGFALANMHPLPPSTTPHHHFTWRAQN